MMLPDLFKIGPLKEPRFYFYHPPSLSKEDTASWINSISEGGIGRLEGYIKYEALSIQISCTDSQNMIQTQPYFYSSYTANTEGFQFYLKHPSFYAINCEDQYSLLTPIEQFEGEGWIQISFHKDKKERWKSKFIQQYEDYLKGVDYPSSYIPIRALQLKLAHLTEKLNLPTAPIPSFEERKKQLIYRTQISGLVTGTDAARNLFIQTLLMRFNENKGENEWGVERHKISRNYSKWRDYSKQHYLLLPEHELINLLPCTSTRSRINPKPALHKRPIEKKSIFPIFHFLPRGKELDEPFLLDVFERELNGALEKLGVIKEEGLKITGFEQGPTLLRLNISLPKGIRLSDLQKNISDWQTELGVTDLLVFQGREKGIGTLTLPRQQRQTVFLRDLVDTKAFQDYAKDKILPFVVGATETGEPLFEDLVRVKHLLVAGTTGSGKSIWLLQLILTLLLWVPSNQLMMYLIDPKRVEFPSFSPFKNVKVYTEMEEAQQLLQALIELMETRYEQLGKEGVRNIAQYNRKCKESPMPYVVAVIDEFSDFCMQDEDGIVEDSIIRLAQKSRACGIHLIIATQRPSVDVVTGLIKANLPSRVIFHCSGRNDYSTILDQKPPFNLLGKGDGACLMEGKGLKRFQGAIIAKTEEEMDHLIHDYGKNQSGTTPLSIEVTTKQQQSVPGGPLEELKRYIAFTGETRVTHLRKHMKMRMNDVKELMQLLVDEKWLEAPKTRNSGYKLILSDKEREDYLAN